MKGWIVTSEGFYLRSLTKALRGDGVDGGAFVSDERKAQPFTKGEAMRAAHLIYRGRFQKRGRTG